MGNYYDNYKAEAEKAIRGAISEKGCQPILFVGSGLSRRLFGGPNWIELLDAMAKICPRVENDLAYYQQRYANLADVGSIFAEKFQEWAWTPEGRRSFPKELFGASQRADSYLKQKVAEHFTKVMPKSLASLKPALRAEAEALQAIHPHAIITTNYDQFLELAFPEFSPVVGQQILRANYVSIGEIFKIHGCSSNASTLVLTKEDYEEWSSKKKYLSAKLLTYFAEHPLVFIGYGAGDVNVRAILSDIDEILADPEGLVRNIFFLNFNSSAELQEDLPTERLIRLEEGRAIRVKNIDAADYKWIYDAFGSGTAIEQVNPKLLRALLARNYDLVRHDIPRKTVQVNFATLEHAVQEDGTLARLLGIATLDDPSVFNAHYPFTLTGVAEKLGYTYWSRANQLIEQIIRDKAIDIKSFDNVYHVKLKVGKSETSVTNKYSQACVDLLKRVSKGLPYELNTSVRSSPD